MKNVLKLTVLLSLFMELKEWYGSTALIGVNETHNRIAKTPI
jgi:hypothetical protein